MIAHVIGSTGDTVGVTTTDGVFIGGHPVAHGDMTGPRSARAVLADPAVDVAVLETARGGIARSGLGYDWSDISIITNIQMDHIGQDGIENLDDLLHIKSLVAERVRRGGTLILNADDERVAGLVQQRNVKRVKKQIVYFSLNGRHPLLREHRAAGGTVYFLRNGWLVEAVGDLETRLVQAKAIPITLGGIAQYHVANALAAAAACRAYGMSRRALAAGMSNFCPEYNNHGRTELYRVGAGMVVVDYGHNPAAIEAVTQMIARWEGHGETMGIIGLPGDRDEEVLREAAHVAARGFDRLIIREDRDLRGRAAGEAPAIICSAAQQVAPDQECRIIPDEALALDAAIREMQPNDLVVIFYERFEAVRAVLERHGAVQVDDPAPESEEVLQIA